MFWAQTPASEKLLRLEDLLAQRQENLEEQKSILKDAHEDLAKLQKSLQTAQDVAKIFQELEQARSVTVWKLRKVLRNRQRLKCIWRNCSLPKGCRKPLVA